MLRRVVAWLQSEKGRKAVLQCLADKAWQTVTICTDVQTNTTVSFLACPDCCVPQASIGTLEELKSIAEQLKEMQAAASKKPAAAPAAAPADSGTLAALPDAAEDGLGDAPIDMEVDEVPMDPLVEKAERLASAELVKLNLHFDGQAWQDELKMQCFMGAKIVAVIDSPTSKVKIVADQLVYLVESLKQTLDSLDDVHIVVTVGKRLDLLHMVVQKIDAILPKRASYVVSSSAAEESLACVVQDGIDQFSWLRLRMKPCDCPLNKADTAPSSYLHGVRSRQEIKRECACWHQGQQCEVFPLGGIAACVPRPQMPHARCAHAGRRQRPRHWARRDKP